MIALLASVLAASLLGSLHCAGMCGGLVSVVSTGSAGRGLMGQITYHAGRLVIYVSLGALAGSLGIGVNWVGEVAGLAQLAAAAAALFLIAWAVGETVPWFRRRRERRALLHAPKRRGAFLYTLVLSRMATLPPPARGAVLGVASGMLPCGWLYAFVLTAAGSGSTVVGALSMAMFWLGTVPVLLGVSALLRRLSGLFEARVPVLFAAVLLSVGLGTLVMRQGIALPNRVDPSLLEGGAVPPCHQREPDER